MTEIKPALTAEEWADFLQQSYYEGWLYHARAAADGEEPPITSEHATAALALHGQPFGFTWEDVDLLRREYKSEYAGTDVPDGLDMLDLADRIAALLPPRPEK